MELIILQGIGDGGTIRLNLNHLVGYNEEQIWLLGEVIEITPGTALALDNLLKHKSGVAFLKVESPEGS